MGVLGKDAKIIEITGSLSYRPFTDEEGYQRHDVSIIAGFVKKVEIGKSDEPSTTEISEAAEAVKS